MEIKYLGHSSFLLKGKTTTVITDPYDSEMVGLKFPKHLSSDIVTVSHDHKDHNSISEVEGQPFVVSGPGEYEIKGVQIVGLPSFHDKDSGVTRGKNIIYRITIDKINIVHLGDLGHVLKSGVIDELDAVDVLLVPVGGIFTIDSNEAKSLISEVEPSIVIPMHYKHPELNQKNFGELAELSVFLKEIGKEGIVPQPKLVLAKDKLPEEMQVVVLE